MKLNGNTIIFKKEVPLILFLQQNKYDISRIAVELNGDIVPKAEYAGVLLSEKDSVEVVSFVGGG
ncbi:sulfur carrier protein [Ruminiclostridium sufflavum DSM 19573]|uniref:Sulfur carrier protein n=1 Tax=Ruminiclostridium sufflavum DSM 19573 TaxID=1121337 RepID=A0A318XMH7_9FIRM|nr:sulfur carrier protein [Ruminiclostridium sufflavum DSM 19573]